MPEKSNGPVKIAQRLSPDRLSSYLNVMGGDLRQALNLYKWNIALSGALFEAIAIVEVVVRNEIDMNLQVWAQSLDPSHGKVLAELNFGFWRFLVANRYLHTIWIPAMNGAFPNLEGHPGKRREMVEHSIERLWFLRNRIGHHEPIHTRNIELDVASMTFLLDWICLDTSAWASAQRRVQDVLIDRPSLK